MITINLKKVTSSTSSRIQSNHAEPSCTSKSNIPIVSFQRQIHSSFTGPHRSTQGEVIMKLLINTTEGGKFESNFSQRRTVGKCRQIISWRSLTRQTTLFISVHKCRSFSQRAQQAAMTHGGRIMEMEFTRLKFNFISILFNLFKYVIFVLFVMTLHLIQTSVQ